MLSLTLSLISIKIMNLQRICRMHLNPNTWMRMLLVESSLWVISTIKKWWIQGLSWNNTMNSWGIWDNLNNTRCKWMNPFLSQVSLTNCLHLAKPLRTLWNTKRKSFLWYNLVVTWELKKAFRLKKVARERKRYFIALLWTWWKMTSIKNNNKGKRKKKGYHHKGSNKKEKLVCCNYNKPGHMKRDCCLKKNENGATIFR